MSTLLILKICLMCHKQVLRLDNNKIADAGLTAFAKAVESGALARCTLINLYNNQASDEAKKSVQRALKDRWLDGDFIVKNLSDVQSLDCSELGWGDAEMLKLASAIEHAHASGALPKLKELHLNHNQIGDVGMQALAGAVSKGALDKLEVSWCPTALSPCLDTWCVHSPDSEHLFDVPCAGTLAQGQQHWRCRPHRFC